MMKPAYLLLFLLAAHSAYAALTPSVLVDNALRGAILLYNVDHTKCDVSFPDTLPAYSFGEVMQGIHLVGDGSSGWTLSTTSERPVNSSRFQTDNGAWRVTEVVVAVEPSSQHDATAVITLTDIEQGNQGKVLATGKMTCKTSTGGFSVNAQRMPGHELNQESEILETLQSGQQMTYAIDLSACTEKGDSHISEAAPQFWSAPITDYRIPHNSGGQSMEFTSIVYSPTHREVANIRIQSGNQVEVKAYAMYRPPRHSTPVSTLNCTLGMGGSFHVYRV